MWTALIGPASAVAMGLAVSGCNPWFHGAWVILTRLVWLALSRSERSRRAGPGPVTTGHGPVRSARAAITVAGGHLFAVE